MMSMIIQVFKKITIPFKKPGDIFHGWWLVVAGVFLLTIMSISVFRGMGVLLVVLQKEFQWSRTQISVGGLFSRVEGAALGPLEGLLIDKLGSRRMILIGYSIMALGFILFSRISNLWQFYVVFAFITLGSGLGGWLAVISLLNNWFVKSRSIAMAGAMSGIHIAGFLLPLFAIAMESVGFRITTFSVAILILIVLLPAVKIIRNRPEDMGLLPDNEIVEANQSTLTENEASGPVIEPRDGNLGQGGSEAVEISKVSGDFTAREALFSSTFWMLTLAHITSTLSIVTLSLHLTPRLTDMGLKLSTASYIEMTYSILALPTIFIAGWLGDKMSKKYLIVLFLVLQSVSTFILTFAGNLQMVLVFAVIYGVAFGGRIPLMSAIRGDYFGRKAFATISGWSMLPNGILMAVAPVWAGWMFDNYQSYQIPFFTFAVLNLMGALIMLFVNKPRPKKTQVIVGL